MALDDSFEDTEGDDFESGAFVELKQMVSDSLEGKTPAEIASYYSKYQRDKSKHGMMLVEEYVGKKSPLFRFQFYRQVASTNHASEKTAKINEKRRQQQSDDYSVI